MADGAYRLQHPGGQYYYQQHNQQNHHQRHVPRNGSPPNSRNGYVNDTPSPSRSPISHQAALHNPYGVYNGSHQQSHNPLINGAQHQRYGQIGMGHKYQHQGHHQHQNQQHHHQQTHGGNHATALGHQHTFSSGAMSSTAQQFMHNNIQNGTSNGNQNNANDPTSEHWALQLQLCAESRQNASMSHHHCKRDTVTRAKDPTQSDDQSGNEGSEERNRASTNKVTGRQNWDSIDMSGQGLQILGMNLFHQYGFLSKMFIDNNRLSRLHPAIGQLKNLNHLDVSQNELVELPSELGMLVNLKVLLLFDNQIQDLPVEMGHLFKLEILGIEGNPLNVDVKNHLMKNDTRSVITTLRETRSAGIPPNQREWLTIDENAASEQLSVMSYNILCDRYATVSQYGYTPSEALAWSYRKQMILDELTEASTDFFCLQEVDQENYNEFFRKELAAYDYRGVFWPKTRARTMNEREARLVDGCATFYKNSKYILLDKTVIEFTNIAINRADMKGENDVFNRVMPRDNIAVIAFLENRQTGSRLIVVNAHILWDPAYEDVKLVQVAILMEQVQKLAEIWARHPPCTSKAAFRHADADGDTKDELGEAPPTEMAPSQMYKDPTQIPLLICGDFNANTGSGVHDLILNGRISPRHPDLGNYRYGNFTKDGMQHPFLLKSAYNNELSFTNYTPNFQGVLDYIWYSHNNLQLKGILGEVDLDYLRNVPGFPNHHFASDHLPIRAEFAIKPKKEPKAIGAERGN